MDYFGLLIALYFGVAILQPVVQRRILAMQRQRQIRKIEQARGSRVITMIHRQETSSILGLPVSRMISLEDAQAIIPTIEETPADTPIDLILHTPGGMVLAAMQIARAIKAHPSRVTVHVPVYAMSGGTLIALAADEIVMGKFSVLGPIDPQLSGIPAASLVSVIDQKSVEDVSDLTLIFSDLAAKALRQVKTGAIELMEDRLDKVSAESLAEKLAGGYWTHDYALTANEALELGLPVSVGLSPEVLQLLMLYPQPVRQSPSVEYLPQELPRQLRRFVEKSGS